MGNWYHIFFCDWHQTRMLNTRKSTYFFIDLQCLTLDMVAVKAYAIISHWHVEMPMRIFSWIYCELYFVDTLIHENSIVLAY